MRVFRSFVRTSCGASAVEFAIISPILIVILMGIIEFGLILSAQASAQNAARSVVRDLSVNKITAAQAQGRVREMISSWVAGHETTTVTQTTPGTPATNLITLDVSFSALDASPIRFFSTLLDDVTLDASVTMQQEDKL